MYRCALPLAQSSLNDDMFLAMNEKEKDYTYVHKNICAKYKRLMIAEIILRCSFKSFVSKEELPDKFGRNVEDTCSDIN
jgi:hypothetical protein